MIESNGRGVFLLKQKAIDYKKPPVKKEYKLKRNLSDFTNQSEMDKKMKGDTGMKDAAKDHKQQTLDAMFAHNKKEEKKPVTDKLYDFGSN